MPSLKRSLAGSILASLADSPAVFIQGPRQSGKSTLAKALASEGFAARYLTLDDAVTLAAAQSDPQGFIGGFASPIIVDEVQRVPALAQAIKAAVDADRKAGRFLLTGSANVLSLPRVSESLAGRMEIHTLWPLSQSELEATPGGFIDALYAERFDAGTVSGEEWPRTVERLVQGGYPEMLQRPTEERRAAWFGSYLTAILQRDVRDISNVRDLADLPRLLALIASRAGGLLDYADLARGVGMPQTTLKRYMGLLEATFLIQTLPSWFTNIGKRLVKAPKLLMNDTGLLAHLIGADAARLRADRTLAGGILENFVGTELLKQRGWSKARVGLFHFRTGNGEEVDFVLEDPAGRVAGVEVKASATLDAAHFKGLRALAAAAGDRFVRGVVLYGGKEAVPFGDRLFALPLPALWRTPAP